MVRTSYVAATAALALLAPLAAPAVTVVAPGAPPAAAEALPEMLEARPREAGPAPSPLPEMLEARAPTSLPPLAEEHAAGGEDDIRLLQRALTRAGYPAGPIDGRLGPMTEAAIRVFQEDAGLPVDGRPSPALRARLGLPEPEMVADAAADPPAPPVPVAREPEPAPGIPPVPAPRPEAALAEIPPVPESAAVPEPSPRIEEEPAPAVVPPVASAAIDLDELEPGAGPAWRRVAGEVVLGPGESLRLSVRPAATDAPARPEQLALLVVGALFEPTGPAPRPGIGRRAEAYRPGLVANAFALELNLRARVGSGVLDLGPYQGERNRGYRLTYLKGERERLELRNVQPRGYIVLAHAEGPLGIADGRPRRLRWTRDGEGRMVVSLDGEPVIEAVDRSFQSDFDGLVVLNLGGDYAIEGLRLE